MTTRREFLQAGIAVTGIPIAAGAFTTVDKPALREGSAITVQPAALALYKAVFDERFPESVSFAAEMRRLGIAIHGIIGDMTDLWYSDLHPQWRKSPVAVAGLTAQGPLFCLERLAWDHGMRVVFRAEHQYRSDGCVEHAISADKATFGDAAGLAASGSDWSAHVARLVRRCRPGRLENSSAIITPSGQPPRGDQERLVSWVIAPRVRS